MELLAVRGLDGTTDMFRRELVAVAQRLALNPSYLAAVISFETGGTFSPSIRNPASGAVGLIQFTKTTAIALGTTLDWLAGLSAIEQLAWVQSYYGKVLGPRSIDSVADHYLAVFAPAGLGKGADFVLYASPSVAYEQNKALDRNSDGTITAAEAAAPVQGIVNAARERPPIIVQPFTPPPPAPAPGVVPQPSGRAVLGGLALLGLAFAAWRRRMGGRR